ncbi:MAG: Type 1 glutamine amidotransferase-like domain-containing protein, partial [Aggregatilineales bacterium]
AIPGLGFLKGSACPHYDGEPERRPTVLRMVKEGEIIPGIAIQDYAAAHYIDGQLHQVVASRPDKHAFYVSVEDGEAHEEALNVTYLGK